jgi:hypothetical protein
LIDLTGFVSKQGKADNNERQKHTKKKDWGGAIVEVGFHCIMEILDIIK